MSGTWRVLYSVNVSSFRTPSTRTNIVDAWFHSNCKLRRATVIRTHDGTKNHVFPYVYIPYLVLITAVCPEIG